VDSGYPSAELIVGSRATFGIALITPVLADPSPQARAGAGFDRAAFHIDWDAQQVRCPKGHPSASWSACTQRGTQAVVMKFPAPLCQACPVRNQCTTTSRGGRQLTVRHRQVQQALDDARAQQKTKHWQTKYALRAGSKAPSTRPSPSPTCDTPVTAAWRRCTCNTCTRPSPST
jgi:hypothetical protein